MLNEIFRLVGSVFVDNESAKKNIDEVTDHAETQHKELRQKLANFGKSAIKFGTAFGAVATAVGGALVNAAESTRDYRSEMAKLKTAFENNNHSAGDATKTYQGLVSVLGDTDQAVEAAGHIAAIADNSKDMQNWVDICTGVYARFGDSLPVESLTEAANETAKTGELTGALADALNWAGHDEEEFQKKLDACSTEQERAQLITSTLTDEYGDSAEAFRENNAEVIAANEAQEKLNSSLAKVGEAAEPAITAMNEWVANLLESVVPAVETAADAVIGLLDLFTIKSAGGDLYDENGNLLDPTITPFMREMYTDEELRNMGYDPSSYWKDLSEDLKREQAKPHKNGLDFVPRDDYLASLHYGEAVLTQEEATAWRSGRMGGLDYDRLAEAMAQRPMAFNIDGKSFAVMLARELSRTIGNRNIQSLMAMGG